ncbi:MAG: hypothetical protein AMS27_09255 [Bacteroides sp. SM23_62_1]|nr:MAG: hypothetical protein AMS27_09255 [Bacteroides sp. SM23_62_1]
MCYYKVKMDWNDFQKFYKIIENDQLSLFYRGNFADEVTVRLIDISDIHFGRAAKQSQIRKKVAFLMAECFQNVIRHGDVNPLEEGLHEHAGYFMTRNRSGNYFIASGNLIAAQYVNNLRSKIENINRLDQEELKTLYLKVLGTDEISSKGGAGLGLIEMARKSGKKLESDFRKINDRFAFFYLQMLIAADNHKISGDLEDNCTICQSVNLNEILAKNDVLMAYQGDFKQDSILPLLNMIDQNLHNKTPHTSLNKTLFHILVEMLQNIMHHGYTFEDKREGIFIIAVTDQRYKITTANYVENTKAVYLRDLLERFLALTTNELKEVYKKILKEGPRNSDGGAGLGLIDIIRASSETPEYKIMRMDEEKSMFHLNVLL